MKMKTAAQLALISALLAVGCRTPQPPAAPPLAGSPAAFLIQSARAVEHPEHRIDCLTEAAAVLARSGQRDLARQIFTEARTQALQLHRLPEGDFDRDDADHWLSALSLAQCQAGCVEEGFATTAHMHFRLARAEARGKIVEWLTHDGQLNAARAALNRIRSILCRQPAAVELTRRLALAGRVEEALLLAQSAGRRSSLARFVPDRPGISVDELMLTMAADLIEAGKLDDAKRVAFAMRDPSGRDHANQQVARALLAEGDIVGAIAQAKLIEAPPVRQAVEKSAAVAMIEAGQVTPAVTLAKKAGWLPAERAHVLALSAVRLAVKDRPESRRLLAEARQLLVKQREGFSILQAHAWGVVCRAQLKLGLGANAKRDTEILMPKLSTVKNVRGQEAPWLPLAEAWLEANEWAMFERVMQHNAAARKSTALLRYAAVKLAEANQWGRAKAMAVAIQDKAERDETYLEIASLAKPAMAKTLLENLGSEMSRLAARDEVFRQWILDGRVEDALNLAGTMPGRLEDYTLRTLLKRLPAVHQDALHKRCINILNPWLASSSREATGSWAWQLLAEAEALAGRRKHAAQAFQSAVNEIHKRKEEDQAHELFGTGMAQLRTGFKTEGRRHITQAIEISVRHKERRMANEYFSRLIEAGQLQLAWDALKKHKSGVFFDENIQDLSSRLSAASRSTEALQCANRNTDKTTRQHALFQWARQHSTTPAPQDVKRPGRILKHSFTPAEQALAEKLPAARSREGRVPPRHK